MDYSCGKCMSIWGCSWCKNTFCDDVCSPYRLEGKPIRNVMSNEWKQELRKYFCASEKEIKKIEKEIENEPPRLQQFFLCKKCEKQYIENNICKGRHKNKIGRNKITF